MVILGDECPCTQCNCETPVEFSSGYISKQRTLAQAWEDRVSYAFKIKNRFQINSLANLGKRLLDANFPL